MFKTRPIEQSSLGYKYNKMNDLFRVDIYQSDKPFVENEESITKFISAVNSKEAVNKAISYCDFEISTVTVELFCNMEQIETDYKNN